MTFYLRSHVIESFLNNIRVCTVIQRPLSGGDDCTLDEAMETLTLLQTGKHDPLPLILVDEPAGTVWLKWLQFFEEELVNQGYINASDFYLFELVDSVDAVVGSINHFYRRYHSLRYVETRW